LTVYTCIPVSPEQETFDHLKAIPFDEWYLHMGVRLGMDGSESGSNQMVAVSQSFVDPQDASSRHGQMSTKNIIPIALISSNTGAWYNVDPSHPDYQDLKKSAVETLPAIQV
jgi:hypothetical protein